MAQTYQYLNQFIPHKNSLQFAGDKGLKRQKKLLKLLNNPQESLKIVHIAGTSGKGSTAQMVSHLLNKAYHLKTGLMLSPHLVDLRERFQVNGKLVDEAEFFAVLQKILPYIAQMQQELDPPTFFEIITAFGFYLFQRKGVEYAVIETGLGGLYDGTNCVVRSDKICLITKIGLDHMHILGNTLSQIAAQKAGIIQKNNRVFVIEQPTRVIQVFRQKASAMHAKLDLVDRTRFNFIKLDSQGSEFNFRNFRFRLPVSGTYQVENAALALSAIEEITKREQLIWHPQLIQSAFHTLHIPGRFTQVETKTSKLILDGAHNPQKMRAFLSSLIGVYPQQKFHFVLSFKQSKDYSAMLKYIVQIAHTITITQFSNQDQGMLVQAVASDKLQEILKKLNFKGKIEIVAAPQTAIVQALQSPIVVVTGSLYLLGQVYSFCQNSLAVKNNM